MIDREKTKDLAAEALGNLFSAEENNRAPGTVHAQACLLLTLTADLTCTTREEREAFLEAVESYRTCAS